MNCGAAPEWRMEQVLEKDSMVCMLTETKLFEAVYFMPHFQHTYNLFHCREGHLYQSRLLKIDIFLSIVRENIIQMYSYSQSLMQA